MGTPSAQTLVDMGVSESFQALEEVPMTMVGGLDVHRQQITFDYVDSDGLVRWGCIWGIRPKRPRRGGRRSGPRPTAPMRGSCAHCWWRVGSGNRGFPLRTW